MIKIVHAVTAMRDIQNTATSTATSPGTPDPSFPARYPATPIADYGDDKNKCAYDNNNGNLHRQQSYVTTWGR